jgi:hypothetical protein
VDKRVRYFDFLGFGTFAPAFRASERPIAIACLRLVTFFPDRPLFSVPRFRSCMARSTFSEAALPYFGMAFLSMELSLSHVFRLCRVFYSIGRFLKLQIVIVAVDARGRVVDN